MDEFSGMGTSMFVATKHDSIEATCKLLSDWKAKGKLVHTIRCDNAGENRAIQARSTEHIWQLGLTFEFTGAGTPQQNALVEKFFETIYNRTRATMIFANITESIKHIVCKMLVIHLTNLFNLEIVTKNGVDKPRFEWWGIALPPFTKFLHPWGMAGIVLTKTTATKKLEERGRRMMYVGASMVHSGDTVRMFDPNSKRIHLTRDVKMLKKMVHRQDGTVSSDQPHPLDTTFDNLTIVQEEVVTGVVSADEVRVNNTALPPDTDKTSLVSSTSADDDSVDSCEDMPPLARPNLDTSTSSDSDAYSDNWSNSTATTIDATLPDGAFIHPVSVHEVDSPSVPGSDDDGSDNSPLFREEGDVPTVNTLQEETSASIRRTRSGRRITTSSRFRDDALTTFDGTPQFSIFDIEDELDEDFHNLHDIGTDSEYTSGSLFAHPVTIPPLRRDVLQSCLDLCPSYKCSDSSYCYCPSANDGWVRPYS